MGAAPDPGHGADRDRAARRAGAARSAAGRPAPPHRDRPVRPARGSPPRAGRRHSRGRVARAAPARPAVPPVHPAAARRPHGRPAAGRDLRTPAVMRDRPGRPQGPPRRAAPAAARRQRRQPVSDARPDLRVAALTVAALAVVGALLGLLWAWWSGPQQRAYVIAPGRLYPFDEVETMAGADGRYFVLVGAAGLVAGAVAFWWRRADRGPVLALALAAGGLVGAVLTWWVGYLTGGGTYSGSAKTIIAHLPLSLRMHGLLL